MMKFNKIDFIKKITKYPQRQLKNELAAADEIVKVLKKYGLDFELQKYENYIPVEISSSLLVDGKKIKCQSNGFVSGRIEGNHNLVSSLSDFDVNDPNINFNPECTGISLASFYNAPSLAISSTDVKLVIKAKNIKGFSKVKKTKCKSVNIMVGNKKDPRNIFFTHIDSVNKGAIDNASGVAMLLDIIISTPEIVEENLFAICGSEELSYDWPVYWGYGYRVFEKKYFDLMSKAKKIIVVDGIGHSNPAIIDEKYWMLQAFPIENFDRLVSKITVIAGSIKKLMPVYHSDLDDVKYLKSKFFEKTKDKIFKEVCCAENHTFKK